MSKQKQLLKLGTRGSPLAIWQAERVKSLLINKIPHLHIEIIKIQTIGDKILDKPIIDVGDKGIFTKEIEKSLLNEEIDIAVHSYKDLPTKLPEGLEIVSVPERDSPFDVLISQKASSLKDLPENPLIATGSLRRKSQVLATRPDARIVDIRGNVNTRMRKYHESNWDALIMAMAGIRRMGWEEQIAGILTTDEMLPAPAQGALAVESRSLDQETRSLLGNIHDRDTALLVEAERALLATLEGGCQVPIGAHAVLFDGEIILEGFIGSLDGKQCIRRKMTGDINNPAYVGQLLAEKMLKEGGGEIIEELLRTSQKA